MSAVTPVSSTSSARRTGQVYSAAFALCVRAITVAVVVHEGSTVAVVLNALRLLGFPGPRRDAVAGGSPSPAAAGAD